MDREVIGALREESGRVALAGARRRPARAVGRPPAQALTPQE
ncbi:hypothetical protein OG417_28775 [Actinoallomurus sp. NBC_01490]|nr:hypothetical protein [Actinoallomurus sp. NBC_01490]